MKKHARLSPSKSKQWSTCTASLDFIDSNRHRLPVENTVYADEGTRAHDWGEKALQAVFNGKPKPDIPPELVLPVGTYVKACAALYKPGSTIFIERKVPLFYAPDDIGTVDFAIVTGDAIHVRDYKHGEGVLVRSVENTQLAIYAWSIICDLQDAGLYEFPPSTPVTIHAIQPRHREWVDEPWETTVGELSQFCATLLPAVDTILGRPGAAEPVFHVSEEGCRFCPARGFCPERAKGLHALPTSVNPLTEFDNLEKPEPNSLTDEQLLNIYRNAKLIKSFIDDVEGHLTYLANSGNPLEGTKLVAGRQGNRAWGDTDQVDTFLTTLGLAASEKYDMSLKSVAKIETLLKEKSIDADIAPYTVRSPGKPVLALSTDKRPAIESATCDFSNLDEE